MKKLYAVMLGIIGAAVLFGSISTANAACGTYGKVVYSYQNPSTMTLYVIPPVTVLPSYYIYYTIPTTTVGYSALVNKINVAQATGQKLYINGSGTCTSGTARNGGTVQSVYGLSIM